MPSSATEIIPETVGFEEISDARTLYMKSSETEGIQDLAPHGAGGAEAPPGSAAERLVPEASD